MVYNDYKQIDAAVDDLCSRGKFDRAIALLERAQQEFPERLHEIIWYKAVIYAMTEQHDQCLDMLERGIQQGFFNELEWNLFDPIRDTARFQTLLARNQEFRAAIQQKATMRYQACLPEEYEEGLLMPLFLVLHGDGIGGNLHDFPKYWPAKPLLKHDWIVTYVQSSQAVCTNGFGWTTDYAITRQDITRCYEEVRQRYCIDRERVLVGGFSGGAVAAIEIAMSQAFPVAGFIALCPSLKPESFSREHAERAMQQGVKGIIMEGETEGIVPAEREMLEILDELHFPYQFLVNKKVGHAFPIDLEEKLAQAMHFILS